MNHQSRSDRVSTLLKNRKLGTMLWMVAFAGSQFACSNAETTIDAIGGAAPVTGGASSNGGSTTTNVTGGNTSATGGASVATGGATLAATGGSQAKGGTTGGSTGGVTSTLSTGGTSSTSGGQSDGGRGGAATGGGTTKAAGGGSPQSGGSGGAAGRGSGGAAGKAATTGGATSKGGTAGIGGNTGPIAGTSGTAIPTGSYCPATEPCRISPLGDSITEGMGWNYPTGGGYRSKLCSLGLKDGKNFTFVGTRSNGPTTVDGKPFPKSHEGTSGITIQDLQKNVVDKGALTGAAVKPHIILLHIGTNNLSGGTATGNISLLSSLIDSVVKSCPDALLVVAKIIPFNGSEKGYNDLIPALVDTKAKAGAHIVLVDQSAGFLSSDISDGVHPGESGYTKMAGVWYQAISQYLH